MQRRWPKSLVFDMPRFQGLLALTDSELLLALCVREENLLDPVRWCCEMRQYMREVVKGAVTSEESERLMAWSTRLALEAAGGREAKSHPDLLMPEVAAFNAYEAAIRDLKGNPPSG